MLTICDANTTIEELNKVKLVRPTRAGKQWKGIRHSVLVHALMDEIGKRGWMYDNPQISLTEDKAAMVGAFHIDMPELGAPKGQRFALGFVTDNAMRKTLRLVAGSKILLCKNGMVAGDIILRHKHTCGFDLPSEIHDAVGRYFDRAKEISRLTHGMQSYYLNPIEENYILTEAGRRSIVPWSAVGKVDKEYRHPTFDHEGGGRTSWGMYNAFTHVIKQSNPQRQMDQMNNFRQLLPMVN